MSLQLPEPRPAKPRVHVHALSVDDLGFGNPIREALEERIERRLAAARGVVDDWPAFMATLEGELPVAFGYPVIPGETVIDIRLPDMNHPAYQKLLNLAQRLCSGERW